MVDESAVDAAANNFFGAVDAVPTLLSRWCLEVVLPRKREHVAKTCVGLIGAVRGS